MKTSDAVWRSWSCDVADRLLQVARVAFIFQGLSSSEFQVASRSFNPLVFKKARACCERISSRRDARDMMMGTRRRFANGALLHQSETPPRHVRVEKIKS